MYPGTFFELQKKWKKMSEKNLGSGEPEIEEQEPVIWDKIKNFFVVSREESFHVILMKNKSLKENSIKDVDQNNHLFKWISPIDRKVFIFVKTP